MKAEKNCIYITYDINLKHYLVNKGFKDLVYGLNPNTNRLFWVFERNEDFNNVLKQWYK